MSNNKKLRKFEGTCYIPGEQLAMMAKYYRGANLNLNLTLVEDDMGIMKEPLDNSCWCSKLDEVDKMKLQHMKGDAWRITHDHHLENSNSVSLGSGNCCFSPVKGTSKIKAVPETKCDKGIDTYSLYNLPPRRDNYDPRYNVWKSPQSVLSNHSGNRNSQRPEGPRRRYITSQDADYQRPAAHAYPVTYSPSRDKENRYRQGFDPQIDDETTSLWVSEKSDDIKCAVCKRDVCAVCKNPLRGRPCHCKCVIPNAGLCNECDTQCDQEEIDKEEGLSRAQEPNQTNLYNLMLMLMSSQMLNRPQNAEPPCRCDARSSKPMSICDSESSSGSVSCSCCREKVQKIFLYNCGNNEKNKKNSEEDSSDSSRNCDCCKCSQKRKKRESLDSLHELPNSEQKKYLSESKKSENSKHSEVSTNSKSPKGLTQSKRTTLSPNKPVKGVQSLNSNHPSEKIAKRGVRLALEDSRHQSSADKKDITNNKKRKRIEDSKGRGNESQSSHLSDESIIERKKPSPSSSIELKDFLVCLPKIKSDLATLLMKIEEDRKPTMQQKESPISVPAPYFSNVRMQSTAPFITHSATSSSLPSSPPRQDTRHSFPFRRNSGFYPNFESGIIRHQNQLSDPWGDSNRFNQGVPHLRVNNSRYPMDEHHYSCAFPNLPSDEISFGAPVEPARPTFNQGGCGFDHRFSLSGQKPNIRQSYTGNKLRPPHKHLTSYQRNAQTSTGKTLHLFDSKVENQQNRFNYKSSSEFREQQLPDPQSLLLKDILIMGEANNDKINNELNCINKKAVKLPNTQVGVKMEGSNDVLTYFNGDIMFKDSDKTKEFSQNEHVHSVLSVDSKHTSDRFLSADEVNEMLSEDTFHQEGEPKPCEEQDQLTNEKHFKNNQSIGPGQFRIASFNAPLFSLSSSSTKKIKQISHPPNENKRVTGDNVVHQICSEEDGKIDSRSLIVKNDSLATVGGHDVSESGVQNLDVFITGNKSSTKFSVQSNETVPASSDMLMKVDGCHDLRYTALPGLSSTVKESALFHSTIGHAASTSAVSDNSRNSFQPNYARLSSPTSEEDLNLPQLPSESKEYLSTNRETLRNKKRGSLNKYMPRVFEAYDSGSCDDNRDHVENELEKHLLGHQSKLSWNGAAIRNTERFPAAKFRFPQEVIESMVQNVHEVLACIESDSELRIDHEEQRQHLGNDGRMNKESKRDAVSKARNTNCDSSANLSLTPITGQVPEFNENNLGLSQSLQSFSSNQFYGRGCSSETPTSLNGAFQISREKNFFVLESDRSSSSVFTKRLRQSLANEMSSPNNSAILTPEEHRSRQHSKRGYSPKPLKRRSWVPPPQ